jgi:hypothetical protein
VGSPKGSQLKPDLPKMFKQKYAKQLADSAEANIIHQLPTPKKSKTTSTIKIIRL